MRVYRNFGWILTKLPLKNSQNPSRNLETSCELYYVPNISFITFCIYQKERIVKADCFWKPQKRLALVEVMWDQNLMDEEDSSPKREMFTCHSICESWNTVWIINIKLLWTLKFLVNVENNFVKLSRESRCIIALVSAISAINHLLLFCIKESCR